MEKEEKPEKEKPKEKSKEKVKEETKSEKKKSIWSLQAVSLLLLIVLIAIVLIVVQVPYTTTNAVKEMVATEICSDVELSFVDNFRTGLKYETASKLNSFEGEALLKYSELGPYVFSNIRNVGDEKGIYCVEVKAYFIEDFQGGENPIASLEILLDEESELVEELEDGVNEKYSLLCTENEIRPVQTHTLSFWTPAILSDEVEEEYNLNDVYVLFKVVAPVVEKCIVEDVEQEVEEEVTRYCNAWKHVVGRC